MQDQKASKRLDEFMRDALSHYYSTRDPFGINGDFITAPEISQLFGETIGVWAFQKWQAMGSPTPFNLIELGPGRGTLMADLLRGMSNATGFIDAAEICLVETSETLRAKQKETLKEYSPRWFNHIIEIPQDESCIIIANEFFDALPVRQFQRHNDEWTELFISNDNRDWENANDIPFKSTLPAPREGDVFEYSHEQMEYAELINKYNGAFLFIDYGYLQSDYGDSLQALKDNKPCQVTEHVGNADLTTHVDFEWLASIFTDARISFRTQASFLRQNGIDIRYHLLGRQRMESGYKRLMDASQMGELFKVMEVEKFK